MIRKRTFWQTLNTSKWVLLATLFILGGSLTGQAQRYVVGDIVEDFTLIDRNTNQEVSLFDLEGKIIFLEWFAYWCPFCQAAAADVGPGIVEYYAGRQGNPDGVEVMHIGLNLQGNSEGSTQSFVEFYNFGTVLNDFDRTVANRFQSGGQPIFAIINGVANSASHDQWELIYTRLGYGDFTQPIEQFRAAIDEVAAAVEIPNYQDYLDGLGVPVNQQSETDDPDFDGIVNVLEYISGTSALDTNSFYLPMNKIVTLGGTNYHALEYIYNPVASDVSIQVQFSDSPSFDVLNEAIPFMAETIEGGLELITVRSGRALESGSEFTRLVTLEDTQ